LVANTPIAVGQQLTRPTGLVPARRRSASVSISTSSSVAIPASIYRKLDVANRTELAGAARHATPPPMQGP
jgi:hypothetical protein